MNNQLLEISLIVEDELVEPVSEVLARFVRGGVAIESTAIASSPEKEGGHPVGPLRVYGYIPVDEQLEDTRQKLVEIALVSRANPTAPRASISYPR